MSEESKMNGIDLGSTEEEAFDPFLDFEDDEAADLESDEQGSDEDEEDGSATAEPPKPEKKKNPPKAKPTAPQKAEPTNPIMQQLEETEAEELQNMFQRNPVFSYAAATEDITDPEMTFEDLRKDKCADFPELEDGKRVSWQVQYGPVKKMISNPAKDKIHEVKKEIETSKQFETGLKKSKEKNPDCKVTPTVIAQKKGTAQSSYRGEYNSFSEADASGQVITIFPDKNGRKYEMRRNIMGRFITPIGEKPEEMGLSGNRIV